MAEIDIKELVIAALGELKDATVSQIVAALRKNHNVTVKSHDINPILYRENGTTFCMTKDAQAPRWSLKTGTMSPTISCSMMFMTVGSSCENPERLIGGVLQAMVIEGVSAVTCDGSSKCGQLAARLAKESGMHVKVLGEHEGSEDESKEETLSAAEELGPSAEETAAEKAPVAAKKAPAAAKKLPIAAKKAPAAAKKAPTVAKKAPVVMKKATAAPADVVA